ncbi:hypothetical protein [Clostridium lacusfryxellense]|uniref:hypothetical protein n=1 Tax=Clostridium lacusfryxellense TaxID=205328 RepID=UPI001C0B15D7|nr:hypothetical protein [Clostridium lacusfryxellense]MBU3111973.1 hypothetical protein [Clostridium lacusfryxellense]
MQGAMRGIFIKVKNGDKSYHKDLLDADKKERTDFYDTLSKGQVAHILEQFVTNTILEDKKV